MKLTVKNFGSIKKATIDLDKKFFAFVGYNNTGKTYLSQLIWGIYDEESVKKFSEKQTYPELENIKNSLRISETLVKKIFRDYVVYLIKSRIPEVFRIAKDHLVLKNLKLSFEIDYIKQVDKKDLFIVFSQNEQEKTGQVEEIEKTLEEPFLENIDQTISQTITVLSYYLIQKEKDSETLNIKVLNKDTWKIEDRENTKVIKQQYIIATICKLFISAETFYLPTNRTFLPIFFKDIIQYERNQNKKNFNIGGLLATLNPLKGIVDVLGTKNSNLNIARTLPSSIFDNGIIPKINGNRYTSPTGIIIDKLIEFDSNAQQKPDYSSIVSDLNIIMGGEITTKNALGFAPVDFMYKFDTEKELELYLSSSAVNQLTSLFMYFNYWANHQNNFLFIDEPELNLHPKNQIALLNILVKFASKSNKVLITTHSTLLADALNNFINFGFLKDKNPEALKKLLAEDYPSFTPEEILSREDFGIYFFNGEEVIEYNSGEYGVSFADFVKEERAIKNLSEKITDLIYYELEKEDSGDDGKGNTK